MQVGELLGFITDIIRNMEFRIPCRKVNKLKSNLDIMISSGGALFTGIQMFGQDCRIQYSVPCTL